MEELGTSPDGFKRFKITDKSGNTLPPVVDYDGVPLPDVPEKFTKATFADHYRRLKNLEILDDDVIICGYPKAGTHWMWEVLHMLRNKSTEYNKFIKEKLMLELAPIDDVAAETSPRTLNSHLLPKHLPSNLFKKKTKILYLLRNPKDTVVSLYFHFHSAQEPFNYLGSINDLQDLFLHRKLPFGSWFDYVLEWEKFIQTTDNPVYQLSYEDMQERPLHHVRQLAKFLQIDVTDDLCEAIIDSCSLKNLKKASENIKDNFLKPLFKEGASFYRKGKVGDWKNWLTVAENEHFDEVTMERLKGSKLEFKYVL